MPTNRFHIWHHLPSKYFEKHKTLLSGPVTPTEKLSAQFKLVLKEFVQNNDIDAAIKRLGELKVMLMLTKHKSMVS